MPVHFQHNPLLKVETTFSPKMCLLLCNVSQKGSPPFLFRLKAVMNFNMLAILLILLAVSGNTFSAENILTSGENSKDTDSEWSFSSLKAAIEDKVKITGFLSAVGGAVVDGNRHTPLTLSPHIDCPCFVSN